MTILITGGAGFIGSNLARSGLKRGCRVRIIDNLSTGQLKNIKDIRSDIKFVKADINNQKALFKVMDGVDYVFHEAALPSIPRSFHYPLKVNKSNVIGTLNVLWAAKELGVKRVIYAASSSVYGDSKVYPVKEHFLPQPISNYGVSKLAGEYYCKVFNALYRLETICLRYFNVFGPYQNPHSEYSAAIPKFIKAALNNEPITINGDGKQTRDFTYVDNVVEANFKALRAPKTSCGKVFNIAGGRRISLLEMIKLMEKNLGREIEIIFQPERKGDVKHSSADMTMAGKHLRFKPIHEFDHGLKQTISWYQEHLL